jgi:hypothetical protein
MKSDSTFTLLRKLYRRYARPVPKRGGPVFNSPSILDRFWKKTLPRPASDLALAADAHLREGRFQRGLSLMAGTSSILAGLEVSYEHYRGSYAQKVMWTPVILSGAMTGAGIWGCFSRWAASNVLRWTSVLTLIDSLVGFGFHVRGIAVTNIVM